MGSEISMNAIRWPLVAAVAAVALLALPACSGSSDSDNAAPPKAVELTTEVAKPSGPVDSITWNLSGEPNTLDPAKQFANVTAVVGNLCEGLMRFGKDYGLQSALAEKVTQPDDKTWVFDLRANVTFWDGQPVTPEDVVFSVERTIAPATASSWAAAYQNLRSVGKTGPHQVTFRFREPDSMFRWFQASPSTYVTEKRFTERAGKEYGSATGGIMCTGPYKVGAWRSGQDITVVANDRYWGEQPLVKSARFTFDSDPASRTAALLRGDVDGAFDNPVSALAKLKSSGEGDLLFGKSLAPVFLSTFVNDPGITHQNVRKALAKLVDYAGIAQSVYGGAAIPIKQLTPEATWGYSTSIFKSAYDALPEPKQDLDEAKRLVKEAGDVPPLTIAYDSSAQESKIALSLQSTAKQVGLRINLKALSSTDFLKIFYDPKIREGLSGYILSGSLSFPEPLEYDEFATTGSYYNYAGYHNAQYDALLKRARTTLDDDKRAELIVQAEKLRDQDGYNVPIVSPYLNVFVNKRLTGLAPASYNRATPWLTKLGAAG
ncbi:ABC transporter substrate-binding protein [Sphaerisporangium sp. NPDC051017]|uniref:ABC transporter substrate-binding protein n=1 Tax=Sphaerisporangium sp. NPDC051017 TaxID=3154636 RepID=UPI0034187859